MHNQKLILAIGFILLGIIGYQGYLLSQKDATDDETIIEKKIVKKDAPEININIDKNADDKKTRNHQTELSDEERMKLDQERIEKSMQDLFKSIFSSKEVQDGISEFKQQAELGMKQLQQELQELPKKIEGLQSELKDDPFFSQLLGQLKGFGTKQFTDKGDYYFLEKDIPGGKESKVDIQIKGHFLTIMIEAKNNQTTTTNQGTIKQHSIQKREDIIMIPADALIEKLQTNYNHGTLEITIPKVKAKATL
jgi:HSP20 family molecular chaperone IbpA